MLKRECLSPLALPLVVSISLLRVLPFCGAENAQVRPSFPEGPRRRSRATDTANTPRP